MNRLLLASVLLLASTSTYSQAPKLTVEKIMRDPKWIGSSPSNISWGIDGSTVYFSWNPNREISDSTWYITLKNKVPVKATVEQKRTMTAADNVTYNNNRSAYIFSRDGDIFYTEAKTGKTRRITQTVERETNPQFSFNQTRIVYARSNNLFSWDISSGETMQLTNVRTGTDRRNASNAQEDWLRNDQLQYFEVLRERKQKRDAATAYNKSANEEMRAIQVEDKVVQNLSISPDGRFITYRLFKPASNAKNTIIPNFVTESGFTEDIPGRTKVGAPAGTSEFFMYDRVRDTVYAVKTDSIPGILDLPDYLSDYPKQLADRKKKNSPRRVSVFGPSWSPNGAHAVVEIRSDDNKDRWLMLIDTGTAQLKPLNRQRDEAWIQGPGISSFRTGWVDEHTFWFQSEASGYSHLYLANVMDGNVRQLTSGNYEVQQAQLSNDKKMFYIVTNEVHPGEQQFYHLNIADGKKTRITTMTGANEVTVSPDEKMLAIRYSYSTKPWELYLQENKAGSKAIQVTDKAQSDEFRSFAWQDPEIVTFTARDGATVYARLYKPANHHAAKPAVIFVHGAGYLQNAHKWWSSYFREYMFNTLLAENGYYVLDIDYRASAGYGRNFRTGIYRYMGGKDLSDHIDGAAWLAKNYGVDASKIGMYGGSYGGFITLMAMFTEPGKIAAGAALRSVTDWSNYNHGYTSNILNEPHTDSIAYRRSSPIYFAEGLKGHLLMLHGMVDVNVHFQDIVELSQRLIELGKDNWELAVYPMEDHGFVEPSSWTDEYKRIFKLFEAVLKRRD